MKLAILYNEVTIELNFDLTSHGVQKERNVIDMSQHWIWVQELNKINGQTGWKVQFSTIGDAR